MSTPSSRSAPISPWGGLPESPSSGSTSRCSPSTPASIGGRCARTALTTRSRVSARCCWSIDSRAKKRAAPCTCRPPPSLRFRSELTDQICFFVLELDDVNRLERVAVRSERDRALERRKVLHLAQLVLDRRALGREL